MAYKCACELKTNETSKNVKVNLYNNSKFSNTPNSQRLFIGDLIIIFKSKS